MKKLHHLLGLFTIFVTVNNAQSKPPVRDGQTVRGDTTNVRGGPGSAESAPRIGGALKTLPKAAADTMGATVNGVSDRGNNTHKGTPVRTLKVFDAGAPKEQTVTDATKPTSKDEAQKILANKGLSKEQFRAATELLFPGKTAQFETLFKISGEANRNGDNDVSSQANMEDFALLLSKLNGADLNRLANGLDSGYTKAVADVFYQAMIMSRLRGFQDEAITNLAALIKDPNHDKGSLEGIITLRKAAMDSIKKSKIFAKVPSGTDAGLLIKNLNTSMSQIGTKLKAEHAKMTAELTALNADSQIRSFEQKTAQLNQGNLNPQQRKALVDEINALKKDEKFNAKRDAVSTLTKNIELNSELQAQHGTAQSRLASIRTAEDWNNFVEGESSLAARRSISSLLSRDEIRAKLFQAGLTESEVRKFEIECLKSVAA